MGFPAEDHGMPAMSYLLLLMKESQLSRQSMRLTCAIQFVEGRDHDCARRRRTLATLSTSETHTLTASRYKSVPQPPKNQLQMVNNVDSSNCQLR